MKETVTTTSEELGKAEGFYLDYEDGPVCLVTKESDKSWSAIHGEGELTQLVYESFTIDNSPYTNHTFRLSPLLLPLDFVL